VIVEKKLWKPEERERYELLNNAVIFCIYRNDEIIYANEIEKIYIANILLIF